MTSLPRSAFALRCCAHRVRQHPRAALTPAARAAGLSSRSTDPVVFSRAETLYGPDEQEKDEREHGVPNGARNTMRALGEPPAHACTRLLLGMAAVAALIHQSDEHGQQQQLVRPPEVRGVAACGRRRPCAWLTVAGRVVAQEISHADESEEIKPKRSFLMSLFCCVNKDPRDAAYAAPARKPLPPAGSKFLLPEQLESDKGKKTLVLDLDETLVHSSFKVCMGVCATRAIASHRLSPTVLGSPFPTLISSSL